MVALFFGEMVCCSNIVENIGPFTDMVTAFIFGLYMFCLINVSIGNGVMWLVAMFWGKLGQANVPLFPALEQAI